MCDDTIAIWITHMSCINAEQACHHIVPSTLLGFEKGHLDNSVSLSILYSAADTQNQRHAHFNQGRSNNPFFFLREILKFNATP